MLGGKMDVTQKKIWQVAAGDRDRNYADLCLEWDVVLMEFIPAWS
jgi:hypothetical protein